MPTVNKLNIHTEDAAVCNFIVGVNPDSLNSAKIGVAAADMEFKAATYCRSLEKTNRGIVMMLTKEL